MVKRRLAPSWSLVLMLVGSLGGCIDGGEGSGDPSRASGSSDETADESQGSTSAPVGTSEGADTTDSSSSGGTTLGVLARASFVIPAGTVVEEFHLDTPLLAEPGLLAGGTLVVGVRDLTHPERDAPVLCPNSHPLDGCATVDYGAFGVTHDNRITFEGPEGPWAVHLYKDRSLQPEAEPLAINE